MPHHRWRVLIVEDDYFIAHDLARGMERAGLEIVGPVPSLTRALAALSQERIDAAVLDVNLDGDKVFEVADGLIERAIPVLFVTGYERSGLPARYRDVPLCLKPVDTEHVVAALSRIINRNPRG